MQRILILLHSLSFSSSSCAILWTSGHINLPDPDAVDFAAKQSLLFTKITDPSLSLAYDLKTYHRSFITSSWHNTWHTQPLIPFNEQNLTSMVLFEPYILPYGRSIPSELGRSKLTSCSASTGILTPRNAEIPPSTHRHILAPGGLLFFFPKKLFLKPPASPTIT